MAKTFKFGITGGIGCGKTYACGLFKKIGVEVYNTDEEVKSDIIRRESVREKVISEFGYDSYLSDGSINRDKFKKILFTNFKHRSKMNEIVNAELLDSINKWTETKNGPYVLVECAVLFENGFDKFLDSSIVVTCPMKLRVERLLKRGVSQKDIDNIMGAQWSEEQKIERADFVLTNNDVVEKEVKSLDKLLRIYAEIMASKKTRVFQHS
jgi:dephospho-CoA kinase